MCGLRPKSYETYKSRRWGDCTFARASPVSLSRKPLSPDIEVTQKAYLLRARSFIAKHGVLLVITSCINATLQKQVLQKKNTRVDFYKTIPDLYPARQSVSQCVVLWRHLCRVGTPPPSLHRSRRAVRHAMFEDDRSCRHGDFPPPSICAAPPRPGRAVTHFLAEIRPVMTDGQYRPSWQQQQTGQPPRRRTAMSFSIEQPTFGVVAGRHFANGNRLVVSRRVALVKPSRTADLTSFRRATYPFQGATRSVSFTVRQTDQPRTVPSQPYSPSHSQPVLSRRRRWRRGETCRTSALRHGRRPPSDSGDRSICPAVRPRQGETDPDTDGRATPRRTTQSRQPASQLALCRDCRRLRRRRRAADGAGGGRVPVSRRYTETAALSRLKIWLRHVLLHTGYAGGGGGAAVAAVRIYSKTVSK